MKKMMQARLAPQKGLHFTLQRKPNQMQNEIYIAIVSNSLQTSDSVMWIFDLFTVFYKPFSSVNIFLALLRYKWQITPYKFNVHNAMTCINRYIQGMFNTVKQ